MKNKIIILIILLSIPLVSAKITYQDTTFSHILRCCNSVTCVELANNYNTSLSGDIVCYEIQGRTSKIQFFESSIYNYKYIVAVLIGIITVIVVFKVFLKR